MTSRSTFFNLMLVDLAFLCLGFYITAELLFYYFLPISVSSLKSEVLIVIPFILMIFYLYDLYADWRQLNILKILYSIILSMILVYAGALLFSYIKPLSSHGLVFITTLLLIEGAMLSLLRLTIWAVYKKFYGIKKVIVIGKDLNAASHLTGKILNHSKGWFELVGIFTKENSAEIKRSINLCDVLMLSSDLEKPFLDEVVRYSLKKKKEVLVVPQFFELTLQGASVRQIDDMPVISLYHPALTVKDKVIKRIFDIVCSLILLVLSSPIFLLFYYLIPLTSKGPAIFKQQRIGSNEKPFFIYKFRSMIQNAEAKTGPVLAIEKDPRITPLGKFMRAVRLDELPQLINVLKGEMSLIGPRPERDYFISQFKQELPHYEFRFNVKPGITGYAQVLANYTTTVEDKLRYDLFYIQNYSLLFDLKILLQTIRVVFQPAQAEGIKAENETKELPMLKVKEKGKALSR